MDLVAIISENRGGLSSKLSTSEDEFCEEELVLRYFQATTVTNRALLETLIAMLHLTFRSLGYTSFSDYCRRQLKWGPPQMRSVFTPSEKQLLKVDPTREAYEPQLSIKLLTRVWPGLGEVVVEVVQDLERIRLAAIHDPPRFSTSKDLWEKLGRLYTLQKRLTDSVLSFCLDVLKEFHLPRLKQYMTTKRNTRLDFKTIMKAEDFNCLLPIKRAILTMEFIYQLLTIGADDIPELCGSLSPTQVSATLKATIFSLDKLGKRLESYRKRVSRSKCQIKEIKKLYACLFEKAALAGIAGKLNEIGGGVVSHSDLLSWRRDLAALKLNRAERLKALGRGEIIYHNTVRGTGLYDVNKWLMTRKASAPKAEKTYSLLERSDTGETVTVDQLLSGQVPQVTVLSGPVGAGKTCLCQYLFNKWRTGRSLTYLAQFHLFICVTTENVYSNSFVRHLKANMFQRSLTDIDDSEVLATLRGLKVLYVVDSSSGSTRDITGAIHELVRNLGTNTVFITTQTENKENILQVLGDLKVEPLEVHLQPLGKSQLTELCHDFMQDMMQSSSLERGLPHHGTWEALNGRCLVTKLLEEERDEDLFYPLPVAYMIMLWCDDPTKINTISTMSQLFEKVVSSCQSQIATKVKRLCIAGKQDIKRIIFEQIKKLHEMATKMFHSGQTILAKPIESRLEKEKGFNIPDVCCDSLFPFLVCFGEHSARNTDHQPRFLHHSLIEVLYAQGIVRTLYAKYDKCFWIFKPDLSSVFPVTHVQDKGSKYLRVIRYVCGFLSTKGALRTTTVTHILELLKYAGKPDYHTWASVLREGSWSPLLTKAASGVLASSAVWKVPQRSCQLTRDVCQLVAHGAYLPLEVTIFSEAPEEVTAMLLNRPVIDVKIIPTINFTKFQNGDALLKALAPAGSVTELWGRLGEEGATALASMSRLHTIDIHLGSLTAVAAFCKSILTCSSLRCLRLHLNLLATVPVEKLPPLRCPASASVYLFLSGVEDDSWVWAVDIARRLGCHLEDVYLVHSHISPNTLHALKMELHPTPVHASH